MKVFYRLLLIIVLFGIAKTATAQDVIVKKDNSTILSKVIEITNTEIKYKKWSNQDGPTHTINKNEVTRINYQNGEVDEFTEKNKTYQNKSQIVTTNIKQHDFVGYMKRDGSSLTLNGRQLSDNEVRDLVGEDNYQTYIDAKRQIKAGETWDVLFWVSLAGTALCLLGSSDIMLYSAIGLFAFNDVCLACSFIYDGIGCGRLNWVADEFNRKQGNRYSLNITPSLVKCPTPQMQYNYGVGATLSFRF